MRSSPDDHAALLPGQRQHDASPAAARAEDELDADLAGSGGPWMMGAQYGALDLYAFMLCHWTRGMARPARTLARIGPFLDRMLTRPAVQPMLAAAGLKPP